MSYNALVHSSVLEPTSVGYRALLGAVVGDAVGVPYEFQPQCSLPPTHSIDLVAPKLSRFNEPFDRTYPSQPIGTWSDDGSQALCLACALAHGENWEGDFATKLVQWNIYGAFTHTGKKFDIGMHTQEALEYIERGKMLPAYMAHASRSGNGSLMRSIAAGIFTKSVDEAAEIGRRQSAVTHPSHICMSTCAAYSAIAWLMIQGIPFEDALAHSLQYGDPALVEYAAQPAGSGYVVDSFWSAVHAMRQGKTYREVIQFAIDLGNDTDTTACIAGGLAGIIYDIPPEWVDAVVPKSFNFGAPIDW